MSTSSLFATAVSMIFDFKAIILAVTVGLLFRWIFKKKLNLPPGPPGLPLIGNLRDFKGTNLTMKTLEWKCKYGDVVKYHLGLRQWVVISSIEAMTEAYIQRGTDFATKPHVTSLDFLSHGGNDIAFAPYSEALNYRRKIAMQAFRQYMSGPRYTQRINEVVSGSVSDMLAQKGSFNPHPFITFIVFNLIHDLCLDYSLPMGSAIYLEFLSFTDSDSTQLTSFWEDVFPILVHWPTKKFQYWKERIAFFRDYVRKHVVDRQKIFRQDKVETLIDNIILAQKHVSEGEDEHLKNGFTDLHIVQIIQNIFFAGTGTTEHTLDYIVLMLAAHQKVQNKVHEEIDRVIGDQVPDSDHRPDLVYTEAVIMEAMRMFPVVPMGLPHETLRDTQVGGYDVPAKTRVLVNQYAILNDPRHWEHPEKFIPERFIEEDGTKIKSRLKSWIPFSIGPRNCIGEVMGRKNLLFTVVGLLQKLHFDLAPELGEADLTPQNLWFDLRPKPYKVVVTSRVHATTCNQTG